MKNVTQYRQNSIIFRFFVLLLFYTKLYFHTQHLLFLLIRYFWLITFLVDKRTKCMQISDYLQILWIFTYWSLSFSAFFAIERLLINFILNRPLSIFNCHLQQIVANWLAIFNCRVVHFVDDNYLATNDK